MNEQDVIAGLLESLGASPGQAGVMASQLRKRADQIAAERSIPREEALRSLLDAVVKGRRGEAPNPGPMPHTRPD